MDELIKIPEAKEIKCDVCGKPFPKENALIGISFSVGVAPGINMETWIEQLAPYRLDKIYRICYPCIGEKLGIKP